MLIESNLFWSGDLVDVAGTLTTAHFHDSRFSLIGCYRCTRDFEIIALL